MHNAAAILAIGDELISGATLDTNSPWLSEQLAARGIDVVEMRAVGDDRINIATAITQLAQHASLLLVTGGLGPTPDDLTREALGDAVAPSEALEVDAAAEAHVENWFAGRGIAMPPTNRKQALRPRGASTLANPHGTAVGLCVKASSGCTIIAMPGVPREMRAMFLSAIEQIVPSERSNIIAKRFAIHTQGIGESALAQRLGDLLARDRPASLEHNSSVELRIGTTSNRGLVSVRIYARGNEDDIVAACRVIDTQVTSDAHPYVFGTNDHTLASVVGEILREREMLLATVESCTGGMLGSLITDVPGSSAWYRGGWVTYSNELKSACVEVDPRLIDTHGAVSASVAVAMAKGGCARAQADIALAITGVAGPDGGSIAKPVGTVFIACAHKDQAARVHHFRFVGDRESVRLRAALTALQIARFALLGVDARTPLLGEVPRTVAAIGLGANLGDRAATIHAALERLAHQPGVSLVKASSLHETEPVGVIDQPRFLNAAALIETCLTPPEVLAALLEIERSLGRTRDDGEGQQQRFGPRVIDLDLLTFGDLVLEQPGLTIPHPRMHERLFVLEPLREIAPDITHPVLGKTVQELCDASLQ
ncbi:MAG: 2-amino-4-hydroxy-6-hydroxymethyldihydropteridine diphosphokinase [Phycisphaerales bacterium]